MLTWGEAIFADFNGHRRWRMGPTKSNPRGAKATMKWRLNHFIPPKRINLFKNNFINIADKELKKHGLASFLPNSAPSSVHITSCKTTGRYSAMMRGIFALLMIFSIISICISISESEEAVVNIDGTTIFQLASVVEKVTTDMTIDQLTRASSLTDILSNNLEKKDSNLSDYNAKLKEFDPRDKALLFHWLSSQQLLPANRFIVDSSIRYLQMFGYVDDAANMKKWAVDFGLFEVADQRPNKLVKGLGGEAWHSNEDHSFIVSVLQAKIFPIAKSELVNIQEGMWPSSRESTIFVGDWHNIVLLSHNQTTKDKDILLVLNKTISAIRKELPDSFFAAKLSAIYPGTKILPHCGPVNTRIRVHLTLEEARRRESARIRVGDGENNWKTWAEGEVLIFEDSFEHEVVFDASDDDLEIDAGIVAGRDRRVVLLLDFFHPKTTQAEREFDSYRKK